MKTTRIVATEEIDITLSQFCNNTLGNTGDVRIVLPSGTVVRKAKLRVVTLSDDSEIFEVHLS